MIPIYIGYDRRETAAFYTCVHSILSRASEPVQIIPLNKANLGRHYWRPRSELDSTDFSNSRWIVPHLQNFEGWAIFMDCDMIVTEDILELWHQRDPGYAVMVKKHNYEPKETVKFLGATQHKYSKKNWSSLMLFNCELCRPLTKHIVNTMSPGLWFHQFSWIEPELVGDIVGPWNLLVGYDESVEDPKLIHYTSGGPWHGYTDIDYAKEWEDEFQDMVIGDNPVWESRLE